MPDGAVFDVIIAGCGPVGAVAANVLAARGLKVLVAERESHPYTLPRAIHLDHEIMRVLQSAGLAKRLLPQLTIPAGAMHFGADLGVIRQFQAIVETPRLGWASDYFFYQPDLEAELRAAMLERPEVTSRFGTSVSAIAEEEDMVSAVLAGAGGEERVFGRYLFACDGGRSDIRRALGIGLEDLNFDEPWIVVDANVDGELTFPPLHGAPEGMDLHRVMFIIGDPSRPTSIIPGVGRHRRWEFMLLPGEHPDDYADGARVRALLEPWVGKADYEIIRFAVYRFHALLADRWRSDHVFIVGDAAHQTPPFFGQGLCHGVRDVANLAWKLELVLRTRVGAELLDSYERERRPQVQRVIEASIRTGRYICTLDPDVARRRDAEMRAVAQQSPPGYVDLIPALTDGVLDLRMGATAPVGSRFIQPPVRDCAGVEALLDDHAGYGFKLLLKNDVAKPVAALAELRQCGVEVSCSRILTAAGDCVGPADLNDASGELSRWFDHFDCIAVLVRPDAYVFGVAASSEGLDPLIRALKDALFSSPGTAGATNAPEEGQQPAT